MTDTPKSSYTIEDLDGEKIVALDNQTLGALIRDLVHSMIPYAHQGLLEGALEMAEEDAVTALREAAWKGVTGPELEMEGARNLIGAVCDDELQEIFGAALNEADRRQEPSIFDPIPTMGCDTCTFIATEIEDWQTRDQLEEGVEF